MDARIVLALTAIIAGSTIAVAGAMPQAHLTPTQLTETAQTGDHITLKGTIHATNPNGTGNFTVTDGAHTITILWDKPYPDNLEPGRTTAIEGTVTHGPDGPTLAAERIEIGCPSTYRTA